MSKSARDRLYLVAIAVLLAATMLTDLGWG
jgi:hypothetical protein